MIAELREENIADTTIDATITMTCKAEAHSLGYIPKVARDWHGQTVGAAVA